MIATGISRASEVVRHHLPLLLIACYVLAMLRPGPGQAMQAWSFPEAWPELARPNASQLMVAVLLLLASMGVEVQRLPIVVRRPGLLASSLLAVWLVPAVVVMLAWWILSQVIDQTEASTLLVGFVLVAAMPVANSAAGWTQQSRGELPWALALVVLSIVLCPWMIPLVLNLLGLSFSDHEVQSLEQLTSSFTGIEFVVWVLLPTALGMIVRWAVGARRVVQNRQGVLLVSAGTLLLLNYMNAASAWPQMRDDFRLVWLAVCVAMALVLCFAGLGAGQLLGRVFPSSVATMTALDYAFTMKNTGLALALASNVLVDQHVLLLPVFTTTLVQHLFASSLHRRAIRRNGLVQKRSAACEDSAEARP